MDRLARRWCRCPLPRVTYGLRAVAPQSRHQSSQHRSERRPGDCRRTGTSNDNEWSTATQATRGDRWEGVGDGEEIEREVCGGPSPHTQSPATATAHLPTAHSVPPTTTPTHLARGLSMAAQQCRDVWGACTAVLYGYTRRMEEDCTASVATAMSGTSGEDGGAVAAALAAPPLRLSSASRCRSRRRSAVRPSHTSKWWLSDLWRCRRQPPSAPSPPSLPCPSP